MAKQVGVHVRRREGKTKLTGTPRENDGPTDLEVIGPDQKHVKDLKPFRRQVRRHTPRNIAMIGDSLQEVGAARSIVIDERDEILAGAGTIEAAAERGIYKIRVVEADGSEIIAVRRTNLTEDQKTKLALYDNRAADLAEYDLAAVREVMSAPGMDRTKFFNDAEFRMIEDRELANDMRAAGKKTEQETVPSVPEGYTTLSMVLSDEAAAEIRTTLEDIKTKNALDTTAEALLALCRTYQRVGSK
jgi:hypothetical protein